jgi:hypothetical protein
MYIICGVERDTGHRWVASLRDQGVWYHKDRAREACEELQSKQSNPNVAYGVYKYMPLVDETC